MYDKLLVESYILKNFQVTQQQSYYRQDQKTYRDIVG